MWAQSYPRKHTNCTTLFEERDFPTPLHHLETQSLYWNWATIPLQRSSLKPPKCNVDKHHLMMSLQLMALVQNIPLNIKNGMRCAKKCCFFLFWPRQLAAWQRLKCASYRGSWGGRSCPRSATEIHSVAVDRTPNFPIPIEGRILYHWAIAAPAKSSLPMPRIQVTLWMCGWGVTEETTIKG